MGDFDLDLFFPVTSLLDLSDLLATGLDCLSLSSPLSRTLLFRSPEMWAGVRLDANASSGGLRLRTSCLRRSADGESDLELEERDLLRWSRGEPSSIFLVFLSDLDNLFKLVLSVDKLLSCLDLRAGCSSLQFSFVFKL